MATITVAAADGEFNRFGCCCVYCCVTPSADHPDGADGRLQSPHSLLQQLCRWLLLTLDRMPSKIYS